MEVGDIVRVRVYGEDCYGTVRHSTSLCTYLDWIIPPVNPEHNHWHFGHDLGDAFFGTNELEVIAEVEVS